MRALLVIMTAAILGGCAGDETTARLHWSLGGQSCKEAGVKTVRVFLGPLGPGSFDRDIECVIGTSKAGAQLDGVSAGRYTLVLKGFGGERMRMWKTIDVDVPAGGDLGTIELEPYTPPPGSP